MDYNKLRFALLVMTIAHLGCQNNKEKTSIVVAPTPTLSISIEGLLSKPVYHKFSLTNETLVREFYSTNQFLPVWSDKERLLPMADSLIQFIKHVHYYALEPEDYHRKEINRLILKSDSLALLDIALTDSFFSLWHHLKYGKSNPFQSHADSARDKATTIIALKRALINSSVTRDLKLLQPRQEEYHFLKLALAMLLNQNKGINIRSDSMLTICANMERWRWEQKHLPDRYLLVNIPAFKLKVVESEETVLESKVIVGKPETPTPFISSEIDCFTIYPYWHIPRKIAVNEILPAIQKDTSYINRNNLDVLDRKGNLLNPKNITWKNFTTDNFPVILRQREGPDNSLGIIKFQFDNPYAVYLHDTNAKRLFNQNNRALSHGCVRVEKAFDLALYLVQEDSIYCTPGDLRQYMEIKHRMEIDLTNPIPVYIRYFTAEANADSIFFYEDIYKMDEQFMKGL